MTDGVTKVDFIEDEDETDALRLVKLTVGRFVSLRPETATLVEPFLLELGEN